MESQKNTLKGECLTARGKKMTDMIDRFSPSDVKDDFIPKEPYYCKDFARLEEDNLWPYVWQLACRLEEIPEAGDYITYDIIDDSFIVVRSSDDTVKAFHNVCMHRGRRLTEGCGRAQKFICRFHGWQYDLDGKNIKVVDRGDWEDKLREEDICLPEVRVDTWGGFVFINMDKHCEPLADFLSPVDDYCSKFEFEKLRFAWYKTVVMPANWKTMLEFFNEFYHVQTTHKQLLPFTDDYSNSDGFGRHNATWFTADGSIPFARSQRLPPKNDVTAKELVLQYVETFNRDLRAMVTDRTYFASQRLRQEVPESASAEEVVGKWMEFVVGAAIEDGAGWPEDLTPEYINESKLDWHVFPNTIFLHGTVDGVLWYRARPNGHDPESCIFDIWSLERFGPGKAPPLVREFYRNWEDAEWPRIFQQDFANVAPVQKGFRSRGFSGSRPSPKQERSIVRFHRTLREFLNNAAADSRARMESKRER